MYGRTVRVTVFYIILIRQDYHNRWRAFETSIVNWDGVVAEVGHLFAQGTMVNHGISRDIFLPKNNLKHGNPIENKASENVQYFQMPRCILS